MRYASGIVSVLVLLIFCASLGSAQAETPSLPACAEACYKPQAGRQLECTFGKNDCTCTDGPISIEMEGCFLTKCSVRDWLAAKNATSVVCERPIRDKTYVLIYSATICGSLAFLAVVMRVFVALRQNSFGYDDLCACLASCMAVPNFIGLTISAKQGLGRDMWTLTPEEIQRCLRQIYVCQNFYFWCSGFTKLTFLFFFLRIFPSESTRMWCFIGIAISFGYAAGFGLPMMFACWPIPAVWTAWLGESKAPDYCINQNIFYYCAAAVNIGSDVLIALIPIPQLWKLRFSLRKKLLLSAVFSVGFITIIISCLRVQSLTQYANTTNPTYDTLASGTWSVVELNVGVFCVCMPSFRRFLAHTMPKCFGTTEDDAEPTRDGGPLANQFGEAGKKRASKKKSTLPGSLFDTTLVKSIDTRTEPMKPDDDELQLVDMGQGGNSVAESAEDVQRETHSLYKEQHDTMLPRAW